MFQVHNPNYQFQVFPWIQITRKENFPRIFYFFNLNFARTQHTLTQNELCNKEGRCIHR